MAFVVRVFAPRDTGAVVALWQACGLVVPWNDPRRDIARKLDDGVDGFFVGVEDGAVVASIMAGYDGHRGWINYLAVDPAHQRHGLGRRMMAAAEAWLGALGCAKINLQVRAVNGDAIGFYERIGYVRDNVVSFGKRLVSDHDP